MTRVETWGCTTNSATWTIWVRNTSATATTTNVWPQWVEAYASGCNTCSTAGITTNSWSFWIEDRDELNGLAVASQEDVRRYGYRAISDEQRRQWREQEAAMRLAEEERRRLRLESDTRAERLLREHLSAEQLEDLDKKKFFYLEKLDAGGKRTVYRIDRGTHGNVKLMSEDKKKVIGSFCVQPDNVPVPDAMLAQALHLRVDEEGFRRAANFQRWQA